MLIIKSEKIPIKLWLKDIEDGALKQAKNLANFPFAFRHIAIMPDCHEGYGMPIGGVLACKDVVIPNAVGVDIGCGMCAVKTSLQYIDLPVLKKIMTRIREEIPLGFKHHKTAQSSALMPRNYDLKDMPVSGREYKSACHQIGTLGGGNHFIEIQRENNGNIWIMIHSGSRNLGKQVADYYNKLAVNLSINRNANVPKEWQLAFLPIESPEGKKYWSEMNYCVDFAFANRKLMMNRIMIIFENITNCTFEKFEKNEIINIAHNYASEEIHFNEKVIIHRKGATLATQETLGIIPGSQGSKSYIVRGKGNKNSFNSCSHGAGRVMGRNEAVRKLNLQEEKKKLDDKGIIHAIRSQRDLEEAESAYKNIDEVMAQQNDLVDILVELSPLAVIKG